MPAPSPLAFWARRQAHETAIHRYDAQSAAAAARRAPAAAFDPAFAADGVDELIMGFAARTTLPPATTATASGDGGDGAAVADRPRAGRRRRAGTSASPTAAARSAALVEPRRPRAADCTLDGPAAGLYAFLWNRVRRRPGRPHDHRRPGDPGRLEHPRPRPLVAAMSSRRAPPAPASGAVPCHHAIDPQRLLSPRQRSETPPVTSASDPTPPVTYASDRSSSHLRQRP